MEFFHSPQIPDKNNNNEKKLINSREILTWKFCIKHSLKGSIIGFLLVLVPLSLKNRKLTGLKQATALSILFGSFRASNCLIEKFLNPLNQKIKAKLFQY